MQTKEIDSKKSEVEVWGFWWDFCPALILFKKGKKAQTDMTAFPTHLELPRLAFHVGPAGSTTSAADST